MPTLFYNIENWSLVRRYSSPYQAPEQVAQCLHGVVSGHPKFKDGETITTSRVVSVNYETETVKTVTGSLYYLGAVDPAYEAAFPNARERLFNSNGAPAATKM